jgi:hypothetical protein
MPPGTDRCGRCGTLHGEHRRCYGCGAKAEVIRKSGFLFVCSACGRPRVPLEQPVQRTGSEREPLARAEADGKSAIIAFSLGIVAFVVAAAALGTGLLALLIDFGLIATLMFIAMFVFAAAGAFAVLTSKKARGRADDAMRDAFGAVALDVMRQRGPVTAPQLAQVLGVPEQVADAALTRLPARTDVRVDTVLDERAADGQVRYRVADATMPAEAVIAAQDAASADFDARLKEAMQKKGQL